jgi:transposase
MSLLTQEKLFTAALGLDAPWSVVSVVFDAERKQLDIYLDFPRGSRFLCPECGDLCPVHDTMGRRWRHLSFFEHQTYLHASVPRAKCPKCGVKMVNVKWAQPGSGFTLLFEAMALLMVRDMPFLTASRLMHVSDDCLLRIAKRYVDQGRERDDMSDVTQIGIDETACASGHNYVTVVADVKNSRVLHVAKGHDIKALEASLSDLSNHGCKVKKIKSVCMDMSPSFISAVGKLMPKAQMIFDRFHVMKLVNNAVDTVRRNEVKTNDALKNTRYLWLKNPKKLTDAKREQLDSFLAQMNTQIASAYQMKLNIQELWKLKTKKEATSHLQAWLKWVEGATIDDAMKKLVKTIQAHKKGILNYFPSRLTSGFMESINSRIQAARSKAKGYRNPNNFITVIYLIAGKLNFQLPT